jgi:hypothetical protein
MLGTHNGFDLVFNCSDDQHSGMIRIPDGPFDPSVAFLNQHFVKRPCHLVLGILSLFLAEVNELIY